MLRDGKEGMGWDGRRWGMGFGWVEMGGRWDGMMGGKRVGDVGAGGGVDFGE